MEAIALCPKCGTPRTGDPACQSCGLASERMDAFAEARDGVIPDSVRGAWQRVLDHWQEAASHDALMALVAQHNCYAWAAGRYRDARRERPGDEIGQRQLDRLQRSAEATLLVTASVRPDKTTQPYRNTLAILAILILMIAIGVVYAIVFHDNHESSAPVSQPKHP